MTEFDTVLSAPLEAPLDLSNQTIDEALEKRCASNETWNRIFKAEENFLKLPQIPMPLTHRFTPGLYIREIFMAKGSFCISKIHKTEHPFTISHGACMVWTLEDGVHLIKAPHTGITKPGTKRLLVMLEDTVWTTYHPTNETDVDKIEAEIIFRPDLKQLTEESL